MNKTLFVFLAFCIGEVITAIFLLPTLTEIYEPLKTLSAPLPSLIWIILYLIIPTVIGGGIEGICLSFIITKGYE